MSLLIDNVKHKQTSEKTSDTNIKHSDEIKKHYIKLVDQIYLGLFSPCSQMQCEQVS